MNEPDYNELIDECLRNALDECMRLRELREKQLDAVKSLTDIQLSDGNWDHDPYMHGMANGMLLIQSILDDKTPEFLEAPEEWLCDKGDNNGPPISESKH